MRPPTDRARAAVAGSAGSAILLSENPIHDSGGGQRSAQITRELLRRGWSVLFVSRGRVTETVDLALDLSHPRLLEATLDEVTAWRGSGDPAAEDPIDVFLGGTPAVVLAQVAVDPWLTVMAAARARGVPTVYDCIDPWEHELGWGWYNRDVEASVARGSDVLTATAPALRDRLERMTGRLVHLVPNAFERDRFALAESPARPRDLPRAERIALFVGALWGGWYDWSLVREVYRLCPELTFVFVGDRRREGRGLGERAHFLGLKPHEEVPAYLAHAEVAFLPWRVFPMTEAMSPVTVYEHVAAGLPVVAPALETLAGIPGVVRAGDAQEFAAALRATGRSTLSPEDLEEMRVFRTTSSWTERVDRILALAEMTGDAPVAPGPEHPPARTSVSVVIPSFQHARYVAEALDSVAAQTLPVGETVVVDDGSTDGSLEILRSRSDRGLRVIAQENRGAHAAINRAIALSRGEYVAILNSDDAFAAERVEHAWGVARATGAALLVGSVTLMDAEGGPLDEGHETARWYRSVWAEAEAPGAFEATIRRHNVSLTTSNFFVHRALWEALDGFRPYRYVHDYDFLLRALELCPDRVVYEPALCDVRYRVHERNTIAEDVEAALAERERMFASVGPAWLGRLSPRLRRSRKAVERAADTVGSYRVAGSRVDAGVARVTDPGAAGGGESGARRSEGGSPDGVSAEAGGRPGAPVVRPGRLRVGLAVPSLDAGGLEEVVALLAEVLPGVGVDVSLLCTGTGGAVAERLTAGGVEVTVAEHDPGRWGRWLDETRPDVVSSHYLGLEAVAYVVGRGVPMVETVHNTYAWFGRSEWEAEASKRSLLAGAIAVSDVAARFYDRKLAEVAASDVTVPLTVIPNAVHAGRAAAAPRGFGRAHFALPAEAPVFVHLGRAAGQKNLEGLLQAFELAAERVPDMVLVLASPGRDGTEFGRLRRAHPGLFARGAVRVFPPVRAVGALLAAADAYVSNSFYEGWSVAASEALWVGTPVVLSDCGGARQQIGAEGARGELVPNPLGDPMSAGPETVRDPPAASVAANREALAEAVVRVTTERPAWEARRAAIRAEARDLLSPQRMASAYLRVLEEAAGRSPADPG